MTDMKSLLGEVGHLCIVSFLHGVVQLVFVHGHI